MRKSWPVGKANFAFMKTMSFSENKTQCVAQEKKMTFVRIQLILSYSTSSITKKNIRFDFDGEIKIRYVRYKHLTEITIKVQLF